MTDKGELPSSQRSDRWSLRRLGVRARCGYGAYDGLPMWPRSTSRQSALRRSRENFNSLTQFSNPIFF
jgi:hypothetical protein